MSESTSLLMKDRTAVDRSRSRGRAAATSRWGRWAWGAAAFDLTGAYAVQAELGDRRSVEGRS